MNGQETSLTIQDVYQNLFAQLQFGSTATLSAVNLPSTRLWQLTLDTLSTDTINVAAPTGGQVTLGPIQDNLLTITGQIELLNFLCSTTITVTVADGEPNLCFDLNPPSRNWTLGQSFWQMNTSDFNQLSAQINNANFSFNSAGKDKTNALLFISNLSLTGIYGVIQNIFTGAAASNWAAPVVFDSNGPNLSLKQNITTSSTIVDIGVVSVKSPFFLANLTYEESDDAPGLMLPTTCVALGMQLNTSSSTVNDFMFTAAFLGESPTLFIRGSYPNPDEVLTMGAVFAALLGETQPPALPQPFDTIFNGVGLKSFSAAISTGLPPTLLSAAMYLSSKGSQSVWNIYDSKIVLEEIHLQFTLVNASPSLTLYTTTCGGTLKIFDLLFLAEVTFATDVIKASALLTTADGLPLKLSDVLRKLNCPLAAAGLENFMELSFSEIGANLTYVSTDNYAYNVFAAADFSLRFFGKEFLALHNTYIQLNAQPQANDMNYKVYASGDLYILGFLLPASLTLSAVEKRFSVGPMSFTLGDIIRFLVSLIHPAWDYKLPEPWNVLDSIGFQNLSLTFDLQENTISFATGFTADFGFINITNISLVYHLRTPKDKKEGVILSLQGTFLGLPITTDDPDEEDSLSWDLVNGKPPAVPGGGDQLFHLKYLGIGQHISFRQTSQLKSVGDVINALENNFLPPVNQANPLTTMNDLVFNENSGWLIGAKFIVIDAITLSAVFNDPVLYGLRVELAGPKVKGLDGLQFEILYKKITETIGLYHIDLRLPEAIRHLEFGEVSVQIPEFILDIYTNGNFKIDVGFPYNYNFERSVAVEVFPFVGFGGLYFGYLESATSDRVPKISNGTFKPVLEFGLGLSIGVGKTIETGLFRAGATLVVQGILEGVLAWFNPDDKNGDSELYYYLQGSTAIVGHVFGEIDFTIVKASVDLSAYAMAVLVIECYQPIFIELHVNVSAKVKVKVAFITIKLSFTIDLELEWTIGQTATPPWQIIENQAGRNNLAALRHPVQIQSLGPARPRKALRTKKAAAEPLIRLNVKQSPAYIPADADSAYIEINLTFAPFFSQSNLPSLVNDENTSVFADRVRMIPLLVTNNDNTESDPVFKELASLMFQRIVNARLQDKPAEERQSVNLYDLAVIHHQLAAGLHNTNFSYDALSDYFEANHVRFVIQPELGADTVCHSIFFPMIPALILQDEQTSLDGSTTMHYASVDYSTDPRFMVDTIYEDIVSQYFNTFKIHSQTAMEQSTQPMRSHLSAPPSDQESMAQFIFRDYFLMITRSMVDAAISYMESYPYTVGNIAESLQTIAANMSAQFPSFDEDPTPLTIAIANQSTAGMLVVGDSPLIAGVYYQARQEDSLAEIAAIFNTTAIALVEYSDQKTGVTNAAAPYMINPGIKITLGAITYTAGTNAENINTIAMLFFVTTESIANDPGNHGIDFNQELLPGTKVKVPGASYIIQPGDTLKLIADRFQTTTAIITAANEDSLGLPATLGIWAIPPISHQITANDTLLSISQKYNISLNDLLEGGYKTASVIKAGTQIIVPYRPEMDVAGPTGLYAAMNNIAVTDPIGSTVSRFLLSGLRLPKLSPIDFGQMDSLFNLTGQQLSIPSAILCQPYNYNYVLHLTSQASWTVFKNAAGIINEEAGAYQFTTADFDELNSFTAQFSSDSATVQQLPLIAYVPNRYALRQVIHWQSPTGLTPVTGSSGTTGGEPNIWLFPEVLKNQLKQGSLPEINSKEQTTSPAATLKFTLTVGRREKPNQPFQYTPIDNFAWGTIVDLTVKQIFAGDFSGKAVDNNYIMVGADTVNRDLLYELWQHMNNQGAVDQANLYIVYSTDPAKQGDKGVVSNEINSQLTAILKTNLSTTATSPDSALSVHELASETDLPQYYALIENPKDFIKLLWECSNVNTGGYYLNYTVSGTNNGLPANIFAQDGTGAIKLLIIFDSQKHVSAANQPDMFPLCNCAILADYLDLSNAQLLVESANYQVSSGQSLEAVRYAMGFASMADFVAVNKYIKLLVKVGRQITVNGSIITTKPGDSLFALAQEASTAAATVSPLDIANAIADQTDALIPNAILQYAPGQIQLNSTAPLGSVGFELIRANPDPNDAPFAELSTTQKLNISFNLLGWDLVENSYFKPVAMDLPSGQSAGCAAEGIPISPVEPVGADLDIPSSTWSYSKIVPYYPFALTALNYAQDMSNLPAADQNPYAGIVPDSMINFTFTYQDLYGNRSDQIASLNKLSIPVGYRDAVIPFSTWPGISASYWIQPAAVQPDIAPYKIQAQLLLDFKLASYLSGNGQTFAQSYKRFKTDQQLFSNIYYQYQQPDMQAIIRTTLDAASASEQTIQADYFIPKSCFMDAINSVLLFFGQLAELPQQRIKTIAGDTLQSLGDKWLLIDPGMLLAENSELPVDKVFALSNTSPSVSGLLIPLTILSRQADTLSTLVSRAKTMAGVSANLTIEEFAVYNEKIPLGPGLTVSTPFRTLPPAGSYSLQELSDKYHTNITDLAADNAAAQGILRAQTQIRYQDLIYTITTADTFLSLAQQLQSIAVAPGMTIQDAANARGMSVGALAAANETVQGIWLENAIFTYKDISVTVKSGVSLYDIAAEFSQQGEVLTVELLADANKNTPNLFAVDAYLLTGLYNIQITDIALANAFLPGLFAPNAILITSHYLVQPTDTMQSLVSWLAQLSPGYSVQNFASANTNLANLFSAGSLLTAGQNYAAPDDNEILQTYVNRMAISFSQLAAYNPDKPLLTAAELAIPARTVPDNLTFSAVSVPLGGSLSGMALLFGGGLSAADMLKTNFHMWRTLIPGIIINYALDTNAQTITKANDTFSSLWDRLCPDQQPDYPGLAAAIDTAAALRSGAILQGPAATSRVNAKPADLSSAWNVPADTLLSANKSLSGFLNDGITISFAKPDGAAVTLTTRANETINTLFEWFQANGIEANQGLFLKTLATIPELIRQGCRFALPPVFEAVSLEINKYFPAKIFPLTFSVDFARVNFKVTAGTIAALKAVPDVPPTEADKLTPLLSYQPFTNGDEFDAVLRSIFSPANDIPYLIMLTRRFSSIPSQLMDPSFTDVRTAQRSSSSLPPHTLNDEAMSVQSLKPFANAFEAAFDNKVKVGVGANHKELDNSETKRQLSVVDFSASGFGFSVTNSAPTFFAPVPLATSLQSASDVPMRIYVPGAAALADGPSVELKDINLDSWAAQFFEMLDLILSTNYAVPLQQINPDAFDRLVGIKENLAANVGNRINCVLESPLYPGDLTAARQIFTDRLKINLADAYKIDTIIQFPVNVSRGGEPEPNTAPRLSVQPVNIPYITQNPAVPGQQPEMIDTMAGNLNVSQEYLILSLANMPGIINAGGNGILGVTVLYNSGSSATTQEYQPNTNDTLSTIANALGLSSPLQLIGKITIKEANRGLFAPGLAINITPVSFTTTLPATFAYLAQYFDVSISALGLAIQDITSVFNPSISSITYQGQTKAIPPAATLRYMADQFLISADKLAAYLRLEPNLLARGKTFTILEVLPNYSLSSAKASLTQNDSQITFFIDVADAASKKKLFMNLDYVVNQIEYNITAYPGDLRYQDSSWISFIIPFDSPEAAETSTTIGLTEIPIVLRSYPEIPNFINQTGTAANITQPNPPLELLKAWDYTYEIAFRETEQDVIYTAISLNESSAGLLMLDTYLRKNTLYSIENALPNNLLAALAQFSYNYQALTEDLEQLAFMKPGDKNTIVSSAVSAFTELATQIKTLWNEDSLPVHALGNGNTTLHDFQVTATRNQSQLSYLDTLVFKAIQPDETVWPNQVSVLINGDWLSLTPTAFAPGSCEREFTYPTNKVPADGIYNHRLSFQNLDIILFQSAGAGIQVKRNEQLISTGSTNPVFVYQTPLVTGSNMNTPLIVRQAAYPIGRNTTELANALSDFFHDLFDIEAIHWPIGTTRLIKVQAAYCFQLISGQFNANPQVPILLYPQYNFNLADDYKNQPGSFVTNLAAAITDWMNRNLDANSQNDSIVLSVMVFEDKAAQNPCPVLDLSNICYSLHISKNLK